MYRKKKWPIIVPKKRDINVKDSKEKQIKGQPKSNGRILFGYSDKNISSLRQWPTRDSGFRTKSTFPSLNLTFCFVENGWKNLRGHWPSKGKIIIIARSILKTIYFLLA